MLALVKLPAVIEGVFWLLGSVSWASLAPTVIEIIGFNNCNSCTEVSYVAPLSEDIDLK
jgi:hypothetical protein